MEDQIAAFLESLQAERNFSSNTTSAYRNDLQQLATYLATPPTSDQISAIQDWHGLTDDHIGRYLLHLRTRDYASSTIARKTAAIKSFTAFLREHGIVGEAIGMNVATPRVEKFAPKAMTRDEVALLLSQPVANPPLKPESIRDTAMLTLLYSTGMRVSELVALELADVDLAGETVKCQGKAGRTRVVPMSPHAAATVQQYLEESRDRLTTGDSTSLFLNHRGGRLTRQGFWLILKAYADRAGITGITPHTLRHSHAAHALGKGMELADIQRQLGHVSISTTQMYRQVADESPTTAPDVNASGGGEV